MRQRLPQKLTWLVIVLLPIVFTFCRSWFSEKEAIHIAFVGALSGEGASDSESILRGINLYIDRINDQGGVHGKKIILDIFDDQNDPEQARLRAQEIVEQNRAVAVIGHNNSSCSINAGGIYKKHGIPAITPISTNVNVTRNNQWYFRTIYNDDFQGKFLAIYAHRAFAEKTVSIIHEDDPYGLNLAQNFEETANEIGLEVRFKRQFKRNDSNLDNTLRQIIAELQALKDPGLIFLSVHGPEGVKLVKLLRDSDFKNTILTPDDLNSKAFLEGFNGLPKEKMTPGYYTNGVYISSPLLFDIMDRNTEEFADAFREKYDDNPNWWAAFAYDASKLIAEALKYTEKSVNGTSLPLKRRAVRDFLSNLKSAENAIRGATGLNYFNQSGDPPKPVYMGLVHNKNVVSALKQFQVIPDFTEFSLRREEFNPGRVLKINSHSFYQTDVVFAGIRALEFSELDFTNLTFVLDFYLWFRYQGDFDPANIEFTNAVEPLTPAAPFETAERDGIHYRAYHLKGRFKADAISAPYGQHVLSVSFHHRNLTHHNLMYAVDWTGMMQKSNPTARERIRRSQQLLSYSSGWMVNNAFFFQDIAEKHAIGHPDYLTAQNKAIEYSRFNIGIRVQRPIFTLRGILTGEYAFLFMLLSIFILLLLVFAGRSNFFSRFKKTTWLLQAFFAFLLLLSSEAVLGSWLSEIGSRYFLEILDRAYDIFWWLLPALLLSLAVRHFIWDPLETKTGQSVPTLLKNFVTFTILLLAFFGVVAFVFDQKLTSLLATSGVIAMIIGLAIQINISNIFSGIALNLERPFRIGDWIMIHHRTPRPEDNIIGCVMDIGWRTTRLETTGKSVVIIPNSVISEKTVTNFMLPEELSRFELHFYVDYSVPSERVIRLMTEAVDVIAGTENNGPLKEPDYKVRVNGITPMGIEYELRYHIIPREVSPSKARHTIINSVVEHLNKAGIQLSYPKQEIFYKRASGRETYPPGENE